MKYIIVCDEKPKECNEQCAFFGDCTEMLEINNQATLNLFDGCTLLNKKDCYDNCPLTEVKTLFTTKEV